MTDYHLHDFIRCPYKFYFRYIKGKEPSSLPWTQIVQVIVNRIVGEYYTTPNEKQTSLLLLELLEKHWRKVHIRMFSSKSEYYVVLAKITNNLLQYVKSDKSGIPPLFLYEKLQTYMEELGIHIALTLEVGEWSAQSFVIRKYVIDTNEDMLALFQKLTAVFCYKAFGVLPERIEMFNLIEGISHICIPKQEDVAAGMNYLQTMKEMLQEPQYYTKRSFSSECIGCAFRNECECDQPQKNQILH